MWKLLLASVIILIIGSGCSAIWTDDVLAVSLFSGAVTGSMDPNTGDGTWVRVGDYKASRIEIIKEGDDYVINFDQSESRTEYDKMKFFFEAGVKAGKAAVLP